MKPSEIDYDSESEKTPAWLKIQTDYVSILTSLFSSFERSILQLSACTNEPLSAPIIRQAKCVFSAVIHV